MIVFFHWKREFIACLHRYVSKTLHTMKKLGGKTEGRTDIFGNLIRQVLSENIDDPGYLGELKKSIETKNKEEFEKKVGGAIKKGLPQMLKEDVLAKLALQGLEFQIAGYHYISFSQGSWFRFIGQDYEKFCLSEMELSYYQEIMVKKVPRESNIFVSRILCKPIQIQFGGKKQASKEIPYFNVALREKLKYFLKYDIDLLKHIAKVPMDDEDIRDDDTLIHKKFLSDASANKFLKSLYTHLENLLTDEAVEEFKKRFDESLPLEYYYNEENKNSFQFYKWLLEFFVFSFFSTIWAMWPKGKEDRPLFLTVIPYGWRIKPPDGSNNEDVVKYATFGGTYYSKDNKPLSEIEMEHLSEYLQVLPRYILAQEYAVSWETVEPSLLIFENVVRQCVTVDTGEKEILDRVNKWKRQLEQWLAEYKAGESWPKDIDKIFNKAVGHSRKYLTLLEQLKRVVGKRETKEDEDPLRAIFIFLNSEPGCGKETVAQLIHLFSYRTGRDDILQISLKKRREKDAHVFKNLAKLLKSDRDKKIEEIWKWTKRGRGSLSFLKFDQLKGIPFFNYTPYAAGNLTPTNFEMMLFGSKDRLGLFSRTHLICGTIFLDEFNTMNPEIANKLLRSFSEPYEIYIEGLPNPIKTNLMIIFASNKDKGQLIESGFNPAIVSRITQNYFTIPPLRERPEDIAVSVNNKLWEYNQGVSRDKLHFIELEALRLICELPWEDNYRGLNGLIADILNDRKKRGLTTKIVTFEEVVNALKRRELLGYIEKDRGRIKEVIYEPAR